MAIKAESLRPGQQILVTGKTSFSRLAALIEGPALARRIEQERARGSLYPTTVPHTTISIVDAQVSPADPTNPTPEETFVHEKTYEGKTGANAGKRMYGVDNKSKILPVVLEPDPDNPGQYRQLDLAGRELAQDLQVTLVLQVFAPKEHVKRGIGLQQVVLHEEPKFYSSAGQDTAALTARGIVVSGPIRSLQAPEAPADVAGATQQFAAEAARAGFEVPQNTGVDANGFAVPVPGAQGVIPAPTVAQQAFPVSGAPAATPFGAPVAQAAPIAQAAPVAQAAPAAPAAESQDDQIARLTQQLAEAQAAQQASGGASAFDGVSASAAGGAEVSPWSVPGQAAPAAFQG